LQKSDWRRILPKLERFVVWPPTRPILPDEEDVDGDVHDATLRAMNGWQVVDYWNSLLPAQNLRVDVQSLLIQDSRLPR
jgi:hypothetical protein